MKWVNKGRELEAYNRLWSNPADIAVFGFGENGKSLIQQLNNDINIRCIIDNDKKKEGDTFLNIPVINPSSINISKYHILISTHYGHISEQLQEIGLTEDIDFTDINKFICSWYWYNKKKTYLPELHIAITTKCTLKCENCNMFVPSFKGNSSSVSLESIITSIDSLFSLADKVLRLTLLGGEPLLSPHLGQIINYVTENHSNAIGELKIITNGTIVPKADVLSKLQQSNAIISISDYRPSIDYLENIDRLQKKLNEYNVRHYLNSSSSWLDFNFPHNPLNIPDENLEAHMHACAPLFKGMNDSKFYYCHLAWSAEKAGLLDDNSNDYLDLNNLDGTNEKDKISLIEYNLGYMNSGYVSLCKKCGGCGKTNLSPIPAALQVK